MGESVHVVARYVSKLGHEAELKKALTAAIPPARRELGCYRFDLLVNAGDPRDLCFIERWEDDAAFTDHLATPYIKTMNEQIADILEGPPDIRRYRLV
jgi:quinol monooxygenase YgiN